MRATIQLKHKKKHDDAVQTIGVEFAVFRKNIENKEYKIQIWDTAGQERFKAITKSYYRGCNFFLIFYDVTNYKSYSNIDNWVEEIKQNSTEKSMNNIFLIGNKIDDESKRCIHDYDVNKILEKYQNCIIHNFYISSHDYKQCDDCFNSVLELFLNRNKVENRVEKSVSFNELVTIIPNDNFIIEEIKRKSCC